MVVRVTDVIAGSASRASEWRTPAPAVMNCTAPRPSVSLVPVL
jgi:hypothetical protein